MINAALLAAMLASGTHSPFAVLKVAYEAASTPADLHDFDVYGTKTSTVKCMGASSLTPSALVDTDSPRRYSLTTDDMGPLFPKPQTRDLMVPDTMDPASENNLAEYDAYLKVLLKSETVTVAETDLRIAIPALGMIDDMRKTPEYTVVHAKGPVADTYNYCWKK